MNDMKHQTLSENLKIRHYLLGLLFRNGRRSVKVPSYHELAAIFNVSPRIAQCAVVRLVKEGYLIGRQGVGTFTNPAVIGPEFYSGYYEKRLLGLVFAKGDYFYYNNYSMAMLSTLGFYAVQNGFLIHFLSFSGMGDEEMLEEILRSKVSGILWAAMDPSANLLRELESRGIQTVLFGGQSREASCVNFSRKKAIRQMEQLMNQTPSPSVLFLQEKWMNDDLNELKNHLPRERVRTIEIQSRPDDLKNIEEVLESGFRPKFVFLNTTAYDVVIKLFLRYHCILGKDYEMVLMGETPKNRRIPSYEMIIPYAKGAEQVVRLMDSLLSGTLCTRKEILLDAILVKERKPVKI